MSRLAPDHPKNGGKEPPDSRPCSGSRNLLPSSSTDIAVAARARRLGVGQRQQPQGQSPRARAGAGGGRGQEAPGPLCCKHWHQGKPWLSPGRALTPTPQAGSSSEASGAGTGVGVAGPCADPSPGAGDPAGGTAAAPGVPREPSRRLQPGSCDCVRRGSVAHQDSINGRNCFVKYQTLTALTDIRNIFDLHCWLLSLFLFFFFSPPLSPLSFLVAAQRDLARVEKPQHKAEPDAGGGLVQPGSWGRAGRTSPAPRHGDAAAAASSGRCPRQDGCYRGGDTAPGTRCHTHQAPPCTPPLPHNCCRPAGPTARGHSPVGCSSTTKADPQHLLFVF